MQTATNPQTGEVAVLVGDKWEKAESIASNAKGEKAYFVGGKWLSDSGEEKLPSKESPKPVQRGPVEEFGRQVGLTARAGIEGAVAIPAMFGTALGGAYNTVANAVSGGPTLSGLVTGQERGFRFPDQGQAVGGLLTRLGFPVPETPTERVVQDVAGAMAGGGAMAKVAAATTPSSEAGRLIRGLLSENVGTQVVASGAAGGATGATREMGGGPVAQGAAGLAAGVFTPMLTQVAMNAVPNLVAKSVRKSENTPFAQEGDRLARDTGIDLTLGQRSGNKLALTMENQARQYPMTADRVQDIDTKIANQALTRVNEIADRISKNRSDPAQLGTKIQETVTDAATRLDAIRNNLASRDYGRVREIAGDQPVIRLNRFVEELKGIVDEFKNVAGADAQKITAQAQAALNRVTGVVEQATTGSVVLNASGGQAIPASKAVTGTLDNTITEAMRTRSFYGKATKGGANVFEDIAPDINRTLASRLFRAINQDFDESATNAGGALKAALEKANGNYKKVTQSIEYLEKSTLGKLIGDDLRDAAFGGVRINSTAGEAVVQKIMSTHPSSRAAAMEILERWNPQLANETRAFVLRDALEKGMSIPPSAKGASQVPISFNKFITALQGEKTSFERQLRSYGFKDSDIADIRDVVAAMTRAGDRTGFNYSNTNTAQQAGEVADAVGSAAVGNVKAAVGKALSIGGRYVGLNRFADAMASEEGRRAIKTLVSPKASPAAVLSAFETIQGPSESRNK